MLFEQRIKGGFGPLFFSILNTIMKYLTIIFTLLLLSGCAKTPDLWDKFWEQVQIKMKSPKVNKSDEKIIQQAVEEEWKEVDNQTDK